MSSHSFSLTHPARIAKAGSLARASTNYLVGEKNFSIVGDRRRISPLAPQQAHGRMLHEVLHDIPALSSLQTFTMRLSGKLIASAGISPIPYTDSLAPYSPDAMASFYVSKDREDRAKLLRHCMTTVLGYAYPRTLTMQAGVWTSVDSPGARLDF